MIISRFFLLNPLNLFAFTLFKKNILLLNPVVFVNNECCVKLEPLCRKKS